MKNNDFYFDDEYQPRQSRSTGRHQAPAADDDRDEHERPVSRRHPPQYAVPQREYPVEPVSHREHHSSQMQPQRSRRNPPQMENDADDYEHQARGRSSSRQSKKNTPLIILAVVLGIGMIIAGWQLFSILFNYHKDRTAYSEIAANAVAEYVIPTISTAYGETEEDEEAVEEAPIVVDWEYLQSINSDVVGWIYSPDTVINYPVVQTNDNSYYLKRGFDTASNTSGTIFADMSCVIGVPQGNYILYGHHMKDGSMFASIEKYVDQEYYEEHPVMYYLTPTANYRVELISARIVEAVTTNYPLYFVDLEEYAEYLNEITSTSFFSTNATVTTGYQLLTLSTCNYSSGYNDPRFLVQGLMIPIG